MFVVACTLKLDFKKRRMNHFRPRILISCGCTVFVGGSENREVDGAVAMFPLR